MEDNKEMSTKTIELETKTKKRFKLLPFLHDVKEELKKVSWTKRPELITSTKIVIGATFVLGLSIYVIDLCIRSGLVGIGNLTRMIIG